MQNADFDSGLDIYANSAFVPLGAMFHFQVHGGSMKQEGFYVKLMVRPRPDKFVKIGAETSTTLAWSQEFLGRLRQVIAYLDQLEPAS